MKLQHLEGPARISQEHQRPLDHAEHIRLVVWEQKWGAVVQVTLHHGLMDGFSIVLMVRQFKLLLQGTETPPYPQVRKAAHPSPVWKQPERQHLKLLKLPDGRRLRPIVAELFGHWLREHFPRRYWAFGRLAHGRNGSERRSIGVFCRIDTPENSPWVRSILNELPEFDFAVPGSSRILLPWLNPLAEVELQSTLRGDTLYLTFRMDTELLSLDGFEQKVLAFRTELQALGEERPPAPLAPPAKPISLMEAIGHHALHHSDVLALDASGLKMTYRELWDHLQRTPQMDKGFASVEHVLEALEHLQQGSGYNFGPASVDPCEDPFCVVYSSGTTGPQKAIRLQRTAVERYLAALNGQVQIAVGERVLQAHAWTFDGHLENLFLALLNGATLVMPAGPLAEQSQWDTIQHASVPTALFHLWTRTSSFPAGLKTVIVGGEPLQPEALKRCPPSVQVINTYGPAEATISVSLSRNSSLGIPLDPEHFQLVDESGNPVPEGSVGEIQLSGPQLSPDVCAPYRTGDLAFRHEGQYWFAGRREGWVKVRGHRVRLQDISEELSAIPGVQHAEAVLHQDRVQVYFFPEAAASALQAHTAQWRLPLSLVPLAHLPLNAHGKVDVSRLMEHIHLPHAPAHPLEKVLAELASEVLACPVGSQENLFARGMDSLDVVQLSAGFARHTGRALPTELIYQKGTIEGIVASLPDPTPEQWPEAHQKATGTVQDDIAVTGANGFLGLHLLVALQEAGHSTRAVVRASSLETAKNRLLHAAQQQNLQLNWAALNVQTLDAFLQDPAVHPHIFHAAGCTHLTAPDPELYRANVDLLARVSGKALHLHHCSSLSVLGGAWSGATVPLAEQVAPPADRYSYSKWQAEQWLNQQRVPCTVYRITRCWSASGGPMPEHDLAVQWLLRLSVEQEDSEKSSCSRGGGQNKHPLILLTTALKSHPQWLEHLDVLPVDVVARTLVQGLKADPGQTVHVRSPISVYGTPHPDATQLHNHSVQQQQTYLQERLEALHLVLSQHQATSI